MGGGRKQDGDVLLGAVRLYLSGAPVGAQQFLPKMLQPVALDSCKWTAHATPDRAGMTLRAARFEIFHPPTHSRCPSALQTTLM